MSVIFPTAILAGGLATRLRPATETIPKVLLEVNGEPFLAHQLRLLVSRGIQEAVLCTGYLGHQIEEYAGDGSRFGIKLRYSEDGPSQLGTGGAIARALPMLGENFFVVYGDSYLPCDYSAVAQRFLRSSQPALMTVFRNDGQWDASNVEFEGERILAYDKKNRTSRMAYIDYGLGVFHRSAFDDAPANGPFDLSVIYQNLLARGQLAAMEVHERFYEAGSFAGIEDFSRYLTQMRRSGV